VADALLANFVVGFDAETAVALVETDVLVAHFAVARAVVAGVLRVHFAVARLVEPAVDLAYPAAASAVVVDAAVADAALECLDVAAVAFEHPDDANIAVPAVALAHLDVAVADVGLAGDIPVAAVAVRKYLPTGSHQGFGIDLIGCLEFGYLLSAEDTVAEINLRLWLVEIDFEPNFVSLPLVGPESNQLDKYMSVREYCCLWAKSLEGTSYYSQSGYLQGWQYLPCCQHSLGVKARRQKK